MSDWHTKVFDAYTMKDVEIEIQKLKKAGWFVGGYQYTNSKNVAYVNGRLYTCDICGKTHFCKTIGDEEADGGYTRWNEFEPLPEGWRESGIGKYAGTWCDDCNKAIDKAISETYDRLIESRREKKVDDENGSDNNRGPSTVQVEEV